MPKNINTSGLEDDPLWYKDAIIYELHVRAFADSVSDGMGDFRGLTQKLDYLQDLGVTALWILPFCPSPWRDDGYDISDYNEVHPAYGTLRDFQEFLDQAHARGLRVITELVVNHTSDQHEWFKKSRSSPPGSRWRNFYVWSDTPEKYKEARIIFKDFESSNWTWDPVAKAYFWHRFYSHQPDLNYDNPEVHKAVLKACDFWFDMGVDGLRLDAVPYLYERDDTSCENLPETHSFLKELRAHVNAKYRNRMLLAEANQWPEDSIAYFGSGDECHAAFHFPVMPRLFMGIRMEDRVPIVDILRITPPIPEACQWIMFLRNHDELTLEMVTDEERDYMYRVYASDQQARINLGIRRRLAPLLENDRRRIELMNVLLFSLPGSPVIYYGDEIGMGDNIYLGDRNGVRTPMQWSPDRNAGFSRTNPQKLYLPVIIDPEYHYEAVNVEHQQNNPHSLLWWMKRIIAQRKAHRAFSRGSVEFLYPENHRVLAFLRRLGDETILAVANLSRFPQAAELDLREFAGLRPVEVFGKTEFPEVGGEPYPISLGSYGSFWFSLERVRETLQVASAEAPPELVAESVEAIFAMKGRGSIRRILPGLLRTRHWVRTGERKMLAVHVMDIVPVPKTTGYVIFARVDFSEGDPETYVLALASAEADAVLENPKSVVARVMTPYGPAVIYGAGWNSAFRAAMLEAIAERRRISGSAGEIVATPSREFRQLRGNEPLPSVVFRGEHANTAVTFGDKFILKLYRRVEAGRNPDVEMCTYLRRAGFTHVPRVAGTIEYRTATGPSITLGMLQSWVSHAGDGWALAMDSLGRYFEQALAGDFQPGEYAHPLELLDATPPPAAQALIGPFFESVRLLGIRTAEMHLALWKAEDPQFAPEPFNDAFRQGLYHGMVATAGRVFSDLRRALWHLQPDAQQDAERVLELEPHVQSRFLPTRDRRLLLYRMRLHGDFHLGQVLNTGKDFVFVDFEGDDTRPLSERRLKRSPIRDVASMLRSFHYASYAALFGEVPGIVPRHDGDAPLAAWAEFWNAWVSTAFLRGYIDTAGQSPFMPTLAAGLRPVLDAYLLDKAVREAGHDLKHRRNWVRIPLHGIVQIMSRPLQWPPTAPATTDLDTESQ
jgi:maltose alpha-D-glucosyltransferase/alpha-amylase